MARKFNPGQDDYVRRDEYTLKVIEVHAHGEVTIRNQFGYLERVKTDTLSPADPAKVADIKKRLARAQGSGAS